MTHMNFLNVMVHISFLFSVAETEFESVDNIPGCECIDNPKTHSECIDIQDTDSQCVYNEIQETNSQSVGIQETDSLCVVIQESAFPKSVPFSNNPKRCLRAEWTIVPHDAEATLDRTNNLVFDNK